ncbi:MAG TPA: hypothetical protein VJT82_05385 [Pyrinomonadaceae bacterium]|nr:hypothetical protein [Pyrinomonadaceae bacterium]
MRFCSRCGFLLEAVSRLLASGGLLPVYDMNNAATTPQPPSPRRRGVRHGGGLLLFGIFLIPFFGIAHEAIGLPAEFMFLAVLCIMAAIMRMLYALFFQEGALRAPKPAPQFYAPPQTVAPVNPAYQEMLPPAQGAPAYQYREPRVNTAEIMHQPSVTDHTTRLLDKQSDQSER